MKSKGKHNLVQVLLVKLDSGVLTKKSGSQQLFSMALVVFVVMKHLNESFLSSNMSLRLYSPAFSSYHILQQSNSFPHYTVPPVPQSQLPCLGQNMDKH